PSPRLLAVLALFGVTVSGVMQPPLAVAAPPDDPAEVAEVVGQPATLAVEPGSVTLAGPRAMQQVLVAGRYADRPARDLTPFAEFRCQPAGLIEVKGGFARPRRNGAGQLVAKVGGKEVKAPLLVQGLEAAQPVSFRRDVVASLSVGGCNQGACHGTPSGKN